MTRPIRVLVAKPGLDGHDRAAKVVALALRDAGMEAIYTGLHRTPEQIADAAVAEDVDVVGLSIYSGAHVALCERLRRALAARGAEGLPFVLGGPIPEADRGALGALGVAEVVPTGTPLPEAVAAVRRAAEAHRG